MSHPSPEDSYFHQPPEGLIHLVQDARGIGDEILDGIQVVEGDQQNVPGPRAQQHLVFEGHSHEVVELQRNTGMLVLSQRKPPGHGERDSVRPVAQRIILTLFPKKQDLCSPIPSLSAGSPVSPELIEVTPRVSGPVLSPSGQERH